LVPPSSARSGPIRISIRSKARSTTPACSKSRPRAGWSTTRSVMASIFPRARKRPTRNAPIPRRSGIRRSSEDLNRSRWVDGLRPPAGSDVSSCAKRTSNPGDKMPEVGVDHGEKQRPMALAAGWMGGGGLEPSADSAGTRRPQAVSNPHGITPKGF